MLFSIVLDKPSGYKVFCKPERIHYKRSVESGLNTILFYLEGDKDKEVNFNGETMTFTLHLAKIWTIKLTLKVIHVVLEEGTYLL